MVKYSVILIFFLAGFAYIGVCSYIASVLTLPGKSPVTFDKTKIGRGADVVFRATDNAQLAGWYFPGTNDKAIMFVHGAGNQNRANEVYKTPEIAKYFHDKGYTILLFDLRGTGESEKTRMSFGQYEQNDVAGAFQYLVTQEYNPKSIGIISDSLGAISTIMAADIVKEAGGIVLDSPALEVKSKVASIMRNDKHVPDFLHSGIFFAAKVLFAIDVNSVRPIDHISTLKNTPLLFLHGEKDTLMAPEESKILASKVNDSKVVLFAGAAHVETYKTNPGLYLSEIETFFEKNLK